MRWKKEGMRHNSFHPLILDNKLIKNFASQNKNRLVISACDIDYLEKNINVFLHTKHQTQAFRIWFYFSWKSHQKKATYD